MNRTARLTAAVAVMASAVLASLGATTASAASCVPGGAPPAVLTNAATGVTATGATLHATVDPNGCATTYSFDYGTTASYGSVTPAHDAGAGTNLTSAAVAIAGLSPNTVYHFKVVATSSAGTSAGSDLTLRTQISCSTGTAPAPSPVTTAATGLTTSRATLHGTVDPNGCATTYSFQYGTTTAYGSVTPERSAGAGTKPVLATAAIGGLSAGTVYHFRIVATSAAGSVPGSDMTLTTTAPCPAGSPPPSVATTTATGVASTSAALHGTVYPNGCATSYSFQYGTTTRYGNVTTVHSVGAGTKPVSVRAAIRRLSAGTLYHFRIVASSAAGTMTGGDVTFTTGPAAPSLVGIVGSRAGISRGFIAKITLVCHGGKQRCHGILKIFRKRRLIGRAHFSLRADSSKVVHVGLNRRGRNLFRVHKRRLAKVVANGNHNRAVGFTTLVRAFKVG